MPHTHKVLAPEIKKVWSVVVQRPSGRHVEATADTPEEAKKLAEWTEGSQVVEEARLVFGNCSWPLPQGCRHHTEES